MPEFTFRYETLLRHRRDVEDRRQRELAEQVRTQMILTDQLRAMQRDLTKSKRDLGGALVGKVDLAQVGGFTRYNAEATVRGRQLVRKLAELEAVVATARAVLLDATQQRRALELLRDRDRQTWRKQQNRRETARLDEAAAQAYARRQLEQHRGVKAALATESERAA
ncbi:MAG: flagellar export protein FliJ [Planctomycetota bacterium]